MSENLPAKSQEPAYESCIKRQNIRITVSLGKKALLLDYTNTELYEYPEPYDCFDHIYRAPEAGSPTALYFLRSRADLGFDELYDQLDGYNFPKQRLPYPSIQDEQRILGFEAENLVKDIEKFRRGEQDE